MSQKIGPGAAEEDTEEVFHTIAKTKRLLDVVDTGAHTKSSLREEVDVSRSTVYNWWSELEDSGFVEIQDGDVRITATGKYYLEAHRKMSRVSTVLSNAGAVLDALPEEHRPPWEYIPDLEVNENTADVSGHRRRIRELVKAADRLRVITPVLFTPIFEVADKLSDRQDLELSYGVTESVLAQANERYPKLCERLIEDENHELYLLDTEVEFSVAVFEGRHDVVGISAFTGCDYPVGILTADTDRFVEWGNEVLDAYERPDRATELRSLDPVRRHS